MKRALGVVIVFVGLIGAISVVEDAGSWTRIINGLGTWNVVPWIVVAVFIALVLGDAVPWPPGRKGSTSLEPAHREPPAPVAAGTADAPGESERNTAGTADVPGSVELRVPDGGPPDRDAAWAAAIEAIRTTSDPSVLRERLEATKLMLNAGWPSDEQRRSLFTVIKKTRPLGDGDSRRRLAELEKMLRHWRPPS